MTELFITTHKKEELARFLELHHFDVEAVESNIYRIQRDDELPVFVHSDGDHLYYEVDLGNISQIANKEQLYYDLLALNTEILPVSFAINNSNPDDPRLVLVESRETCNLDDNEILSVFDALELAADRAAQVLLKYTN